MRRRGRRERVDDKILTTKDTKDTKNAKNENTEKQLFADDELHCFSS